MTDQVDKAYQTTRAPEGWIAAGHRLTGSPVPGDNTGAVGLNFQAPMIPSFGANLATVAGDGPIADAVRGHPGSARVVRMDQAGASNPGLAAQLGANAPSGVPGQPGDHVAPSTVGAEFRQSPQRPAGAPAMFYNHEPAQIQRPSTWAMPDGAA